jgi:hypothetical protein
MPIDVSGNISAVACPTVTQCTAVDDGGQEVTFNPASPGHPNPVMIDASGELQAVACPTASQCTAVGETGREVTFNPNSPGPPTPVTIDPGPLPLWAVACPTSGQCTAIGTSEEVTFNPSRPGAPTREVIDAGDGADGTGMFMLGIACPTAAQCTAVDANGQELTFNPTSPESPNRVSLDPGGLIPNAFQGVSCPTASQCTGVDNDGAQITFNPTAPGTPAPNFVSLWSDLAAIACPSTTECVTVDRSDGSYSALEGNPQSTTPWFVEPLGTGSAFALACPTLTTCVVVAANGDERTGTYVADPPAPVSESWPDFAGPEDDVVGGALAQGQTLTVDPGTWFNSPTSYAYQWEDCDKAEGSRWPPDPAGCTPIPGATGVTYKLRPGDVGYTIMIVETATNAGGSTHAASFSGGHGVVQRAADAPTSAAGGGATGSSGGSNGGGAGGSGTAGPDAGAARASVGRVTVGGTAAHVPIRCTGRRGALCKVKFSLTLNEIGTRLEALGSAARAGKKGRPATRVVVVGSRAATVRGGMRTTVRVSLNGAGKRLLVADHTLRVRLTVTGGATGKVGRVASELLIFRTSSRIRR